MALRLVTEQGDLAESTGVPPHAVALTPGEVTGLIGVFQGMLRDAIRPVLDKLDENAKGASDRWSKHDLEHAEAEARFVELAAAVKAHHDREHDDDVAMEARVRPIRTASGWVWANRTNLLIVVIGLVTVGTFIVEAAGRLFGGHP